MQIISLEPTFADIIRFKMVSFPVTIDEITLNITGDHFDPSNWRLTLQISPNEMLMTDASEFSVTALNGNLYSIKVEGHPQAFTVKDRTKDLCLQIRNLEIARLKHEMRTSQETIRLLTQGVEELKSAAPTERKRTTGAHSASSSRPTMTMTTTTL